MNIRDKLLKIAGKENFQIDPMIGNRYILQQCYKYGLMMIRGRLFSKGHQKISKDIFVGKKVKVFEKKKVSIGEKTKIQDGVYIDALSKEGVVIGDFVVIGKNCQIQCSGGLEHIGKGIKIGNRTTFGNDCVFGAAGGIQIGEDVVAGQYIRFHSENHNYNDVKKLIKKQGVTHKGIIVGNNCWIGAGAVFLDGAELGNGCVVAANAVVTKKFPNNVVIGGVPATIISYRN